MAQLFDGNACFRAQYVVDATTEGDGVVVDERIHAGIDPQADIAVGLKRPGDERMVIAVFLDRVEIGDIKCPEREYGQVGPDDGRKLRLRTQRRDQGPVGLPFSLPGRNHQAVLQIDDGYDMHAENYTGWDIGGAHLKIARLDKNGALCGLDQFATPLWEGIDTLAHPVTRVVDSLPAGKCIHTLTMTGELADCFPARRDGVITLVDYLCARLGPKNPVYVYAGDKGLLTPEQAHSGHADIASANWHATAGYAAQCLGSGVLVDLGTTTTDIIPFHEHRVCNCGYNDQQRLQTGELVYTGITRTPVMAVVDRVPFKNAWQSIAAEYFAGMADVYRITGDLNERFDLMPAADGSAKTRYHSLKRLARMLGAEYVKGDAEAPWLEVARHIAEKQFARIDQAFNRVTGALEDAVRNNIVAAGAGRFIIEKLARKNDCEVTNFEDLLPIRDRTLRAANNCSTAVAVAALTRRYINAPD